MARMRHTSLARLAERFAAVIDRATDGFGRGLSWLCLLLVLLVGFDVGLRYLFSRSFVATRELEWHLFSLIFLLGAGYTLKHDQHVRVDVLYQRLGRRSRAAVNVLGFLLLLVPGCWLVIATSWQFVVQAWQMGEGSPDPGGIPAWYLIKAAIPLGFVLLLLQGLSFFLRNLLLLFDIRLEGE